MVRRGGSIVGFAVTAQARALIVERTEAKETYVFICSDFGHDGLSLIVYNFGYDCRVVVVEFVYARKQSRFHLGESFLGRGGRR